MTNAIIPFELKRDEPIKGNHPLTGFPVYFIPFEPMEQRAVILFIIGDDFYYSTNAGQDWEINPPTIDIRKVDVIVS